MSRVLSYGEALVDFLPDRRGSLADVEAFTKTIGGAPANTAVGLARLGCDVGLLGKIGADEFGAYLLDALQSEGIDIAGVSQTGEAKTGITFISLDENGDRRFLFYREPSADMTIRIDDVDTEVIDRSTIFISGSNLLTTPERRAATMFALEHARSRGLFVVVDANIRPHLWPQRDELVPTIRRQLELADVVKLNDEELAMLSPEGAEALWADLASSGAAALVLTRAEAGADLYWRGGQLSVAAPPTDVVDTTGAGDGFVAGLVAALLRATGATSSTQLRRAVTEFGADDWRRPLAVGCHVGSAVCRRLGATPALPTAAHVPWEQFDL